MPILYHNNRTGEAGKGQSCLSLCMEVNTAGQNWTLNKADEARWQRLMQLLEPRFGGQKLKLEALLLLIGMRERGLGHEPIERNEKMDLMHVGLCTILAPAGYYQPMAPDAEGWPQWELAKPLPFLDLFKQVNFLRHHLLQYFEAVFPVELTA